jgi:hypothetical protein
MGESKVREGLIALLVAGALAACGGGGGDDGDEAGFGPTGEETATTVAEDDPAVTATTIGGGTATRSAEAQDYVDALVTAAGTSGISRSPEENRCFSEVYVDTMGVEALEAAMPAEEVADTPGMAPDDLGVVMTAEQRDAFYAGLARCIDVRRFLLTAFTTGVDMTEADAACLNGAFDDAGLKLIVVAPFDGDTAPIESNQEFVSLIDRLSAACPAAMEAAGWT